MKALERIKQLRHPFLLSLEGIEIVDGRLIIVNELADMSLKQRYLDCKDRAPGIARDELLNHLHDAADALDYLNTSQSLQHLDVKAENLLLVGGRLKVGDFGLVRNLSESDASMLEGMTPRYAAPEVFEGRPTRFSDQFSLAVVYAELLTGQPPFDAKSAAQFAAQHLLGAQAKLDALSTADQAVVRRALQESAGRFPNCRTFVDRLLASTAGETAAAKSPDEKVSCPPQTAACPAPAPEQASPVGQRLPSAPRSLPAAGEDATLVLGGDSSLRQPMSRGTKERVEVRLPAVAVDDLQWAPHPTLFIGLGGAATQVLRGLSGRLAKQFSGGKAIPAWGMLSIDTDPAALPIARREGEPDAAADDLMLIKLRSTQEYRAELPEVLKWLSRRWLYNIPREPRTSRCRPLGRLALIDNGARVMQRLRTALGAFTAPEALAASSAAVGTLFHQRPAIVLVSSIGGGTGSGIILDLAYAVRKLTAELGIGQYELRGLLMHSTEQDPASHDLALANAVACLTEMAHFNRPGCGYPGEESLDIPAVPSILPTFDETLITHLGDGLSHAEFQGQMDRVSDYLYHRLATRAGTLLENLHADMDAVQPAQTGEIPIRTFGLCAANNLPADVVQGYVDRLCQVVADKWLGSDRRTLTGDRSVAATGGDEVSDKIMQLVELALGPRADRRFVRDVALALAAYIRNSSDSSNPRPRAPRFHGNPDVVLANCSVELSKLATSLSELQRIGPSLLELQGRTGCGPAHETPLYALHSAVHSFLAERVGEMATPLANDFPASFFQRQRRASDDSESAGQILQGLSRSFASPPRPKFRRPWRRST